MKKKNIFLSFAVAFILLGNFQFSYASGEKIIREVEGLNGGQKVPYGWTKTITYKQNESVKLELSSKDKDIVILVDSSKRDSDDNTKKDSPFKFALFAGSEIVDGEPALHMYGDHLNIDGDCHSNGNIEAYVGPTSQLTGIFTASGNIGVSGENVSVQAIEKQSVIKMPDLSAKFAIDAKKNQSYFSTSLDTETGKKWYEYIVENSYGSIGGDIIDKFGVGLKCTYANGTWEITGGELKLSKDLPLLFDGNVLFSLDNISGNGFIVATGNILFNNGNSTDLGLKYKPDGSVDLENSAEIGFYSINGNIDFNMAEGAKFKGLVYVPNGNIQLNSNAFHLYGSLVANTLELGGDKLIHYVETGLHDDIGGGEIKDDIQYINARDSALKIIEELSKYEVSNINLATVMYSNKAYLLGNGFYRINEKNGGAVSEVKELINAYNIGNGVNMGDGLKLASETLKVGSGQGSNKEKYLIVLSYNEPNRYTDDNGNILSDAIKALEYAEKIAEENIKGENFDNIYFIDVNSELTLNCIKKVAEKAEVENEFVFDPKAVIENEVIVKSFESSLKEVVSSIINDITFVPQVKKVEVSFNTSDKPHKLPTGVTFIPNIVKNVENIGEVEEIEEIEATQDTEEAENKEDKVSFEFIASTRELKLKEGAYSVELSTDKTSAKIGDLKLSVKFNKRTDSDTISTDTIVFEETELIYTFTLTSKSGVDETVSVKVPVEKLEVGVEFKIDIN